MYYNELKGMKDVGDEVMIGKLLNIQRCSIHNGPGIRTTAFLKGCPLTCIWCHNPESQSFKSEVMKNSEKCSKCSKCIEVCRASCIDEHGTDIDKCVECELCMDYCVSEARELVGREIKASKLVSELLKDRGFFESSGGGVTLSGGEALSQGRFTIEVARQLHSKGVSVALDTCGFVRSKDLEEISKYIDIFLYDIKVMDREKHILYTGVDNDLIHSNLRLLASLGAKINIRIPLIEGINTSEAEVDGVLNLLDEMDIEKISILPYHEAGVHKYKKLDMDYKKINMSRPSKETIECIVGRYSNKYKVEVGG